MLRSSAFASSTIAWSSTASPSTATAKPSRIRIAGRLAGLIALFAAYAPIHIATKLLLGRSRWPTSFLRTAARIIGARVLVEGAPLRPHTLLICNHVSWLDVLVVGGTTGCKFVSKDNLGHGFMHWLADQNATIYVRRTHRKGAKDQASAIAKALVGNQPIALFPEGTTGPGNDLLPFRSTLLEAANYAGKKVEIRPLALDYGAAATEICWWQEPGKANVLRLLGRKGVIRVRVAMLPPLGGTTDRKQLAHNAYEAIAAELGFKSHGHSPIGTGE